jgi:hypothetical protein
LDSEAVLHRKSNAGPSVFFDFVHGDQNVAIDQNGTLEELPPIFGQGQS